MRFFISLLIVINSVLATAQVNSPEQIGVQFNQSQKIYNEWVYCQLNKNDLLF